MTDPSPAATAAADRLESARTTGLPVAPVRDLISVTDVAGAYAAQRVFIGRKIARGARLVGHKVGLTSPAVQRQLGVDQPDSGVLFDDMQIDHDGTVHLGSLLQPKIEAEVAFVLGRDLDGGNLDAAKCAEAVDHAVAALEIVDSRVQDWDISIVDTVADNASSAFYVLGAARVPLAGVTPRDVEMSMTADGEVVSKGNGAACLGDPLEALAWLARTCRDLGEPLRAGQVVLSGALGPMHTVTGPTTIRAEISSLGTVSVRFSEEDA